MKKFVFCLLIQAIVSGAQSQDTASKKFNDTLMLENIEVTSVRASEKAPFTKTNLSRSQIEERNLGQDLPFILNQTPSVVASSDAGNGVGYTNLRIRGSDATRINITLNGIPFNDAESQGAFLVNMPDIASSLSSIQVQRGVGTSSNGPGAFGATLNLSTNEFNQNKYLQFDNAYGSFNTWKNTLKVGTGLINNHFTVDVRASNITSDGYIDRASSNLRSLFVSGAYFDKKTSVRFNLISGKEKTYQAWNGVPESMLTTDRTYNSAGTEKPGNPYADETDNYLQTHYQLFLNHQVNPDLSFNIGTYLVRGKGYYENYKAGQKFSKYGLSNLINGADTIKKTDLILQRWLDNYFYGTVFSGQYAKGKTRFTFGGGYSQYDGKHFNRVTWAQAGFPPDFSSYNLPAHKNDLNLYAKWMQSLGNGFNTFIDLQQRMVKYQINGFKDNPDIFINKHYVFINPKVGISYLSGDNHAYASLSVGSKEPNRDDFEAGENQIPKPERLYDWELGYSRKGSVFSAGITLYLMNYKDQLVNTGEINDVGALTRTNASKSYRAGIELEADYKPVKWLELGGNAAFSKNKIRDFTEFIYDDAGMVTENHFSNTDISFSPSVVAGGEVKISPIKNSEISFMSKFVGNQFLDNTSDPNRMLNRYFVEDARVTYTVPQKRIKGIKIIFRVNNLFNKMYEANGYTYNYISDGKLYVENFYFPMAGINFMAAMNITL